MKNSIKRNLSTPTRCTTHADYRFIFWQVEWNRTKPIQNKDFWEFETSREKNVSLLDAATSRLQFPCILFPSYYCPRKLKKIVQKFVQEFRYNMYQEFLTQQTGIPSPGILKFLFVSCPRAIISTIQQLKPHQTVSTLPFL